MQADPAEIILQLGKISPDYAGGVFSPDREVLFPLRIGHPSAPLGHGAVSYTHLGNGRHRIVVTEIPYQVNNARLVEKIAELRCV